METSNRAKIVAFALAAGRWYTGGFELPVAGVTLWLLVEWKLNDIEEKKQRRNMPRSALSAVRARSQQRDSDDQSVGSVYSHNRFAPRQNNLRQRRSRSADVNNAHRDVNGHRPRSVSVSRRIGHDHDDVSVLSFTSQNKQAHGAANNKMKKIPFSQHEEIVEFLNGKLEGAIEQHNKMKSALEVQNKKLAEVAQAYEVEKRKNLRSQETLDKMNSTLDNEKKKAKTFEESQGSALHQLQC